jgi:hypothetical protein
VGSADWDIAVGGSTSFGHYEALNSADPALLPLNEGLKCRRLDNSHASEYGRALFTYNREPENFTLFKDVSVRGWFGISSHSHNSHAGMCLRTDTTVPTGLSNSPGLFSNGYYGKIYSTGSGLGFSVDRYLVGAGTNLFTLLFPGPTIYSWFRMRLDFLWQSDGSAILKGYSQVVGDTEWTPQLEIVEAPGVIPAYSGVGWGGQVEGGGADFVNEVYVDLVEVYHS